MQGGDPTGTGRGGESIYGYTLSSILLFSVFYVSSHVFAFMLLRLCVFFFQKEFFFMKCIRLDIV